MKLRNRGQHIEDDSPLGLALLNTDVYRVQDKWSYRHFLPKRVPTRLWRRTWQAEWPNCSKAVRSYTRHGALTKAVKAQLIKQGDI